jgi:hypothetical protein
MSIQHEWGCSLQKAVNQACIMVETRTRRFQELVQQFSVSPAGGDEDIHTFLASVGILLRGNLDWSRETGRYTWVENLEPSQSNSYLEEILPTVELEQQHHCAGKGICVGDVNDLVPVIQHAESLPLQGVVLGDD